MAKIYIDKDLNIELEYLGVTPSGKYVELKELKEVTDTEGYRTFFFPIEDFNNDCIPKGE